MKKEVLKESLPGPADGVTEGNGKFKPSHYNFLFDSEDGSHLIFNAMSGGFAKVNDEDFSDLQQILRDPNSFTCDSDRKTQLFQSAIKGGYIIKEEVNELDVIKTRSLTGRFNTDHFHLTIMPTLACNFKCIYCYETPRPGIMSKETQTALIKWVETKTDTCKLFTVAWFGGEPLLAFNCLKNLSVHFKAICHKKNVKYEAGLTTNGYLMNSELVDQLCDLGIISVQVTIDGPPDIHDQRRPLRGEKGTFYVLVRNLEYLIESQSTVVIKVRVNCDDSNIDFVPRLLEILPDCIKRKAEIYFSPVYICTDFVGYQKEKKASVGTRVTQTCPAELRKKLLELKLLSMKARGKCSLKSLARYVFRPKAGYCEAEYANRFVIDPEGNIHKCTVSFSPKLRVGFLTDEGRAIFDVPKMAIWLTKDPFLREKCRDCKTLPICMGGCNSSYLQNPHPYACPSLIVPEEVTQALEILYREISASGT